MTTQERFQSWLPLFLLALGSVLFIAGGSFHPHVSGGMGVVGSPEFFTHFAEKIVGTPGWIPMHMLILAGPVVWALAAPAVGERLPQGGRSIWAIAQTLLIISVTLWIITFVLDGLVAPVYARAVLARGVGGIDPMVLMSFGMNQSLLVRLGLLSLVLQGFAIVLYATGLLASSRGLSWRSIVGALGILVGVWPFVAALNGEFNPGPFISELWKPTALVTAAWFILLGISLVGLRSPIPVPDASATRHLPAGIGDRFVTSPLS